MGLMLTVMNEVATGGSRVVAMVAYSLLASRGGCQERVVQVVPCVWPTGDLAPLTIAVQAFARLHCDPKQLSLSYGGDDVGVANRG